MAVEPVDTVSPVLTAHVQGLLGPQLEVLMARARLGAAWLLTC